MEGMRTANNIAIPVEKKREDGKLRVLDLTLYNRVLETLKPGRLYRMTIFDPEAKTRTISDPMRRYYWAVVATMIAEETGHSKEAVHEALKLKFLGYQDEKGLPIVPSVFSDQSNLTVQEKKAFIEECRRWAWDFLNLAIPTPEMVVE